MNRKSLALCAAAAFLLVAAGYGLYSLGQRNAASSKTQSATLVSDPAQWTPAQGEAATRRHIESGIKVGDVDPVTGRMVLYYQDPMVPGKRFDAPGKSPFMDMMLVPVYAGAQSADGSGVTVSPRIQQNLGVRTAEVTEGTLSPQITAVGNIAWNERDQAVIQARAAGFVERLYARAMLDRVRAGQPLVELYFPEWNAVQEEYLALRRVQATDVGALADAARARMRQVGMNDTQIESVVAGGTLQPRVTVTAPIDGVLAELPVREGMTVAPGATLFRINGTSTVWAQAEIPENQAALVRPGARAQARSPAIPGEVFEGRVAALLPEVNKETRTIKARLEIVNRGERLVPGMFVTMQFIDVRQDKSLLVPTEAVIQTGKRTVVMLAEADGGFRPVEIEAGIESNGETQVKRGLQRGQQVVVSSQFLLDSEASMTGLETRLGAKEPAQPATHRTEATIEAVMGETVTLSHAPVPSLNWPRMTMDFKLPPAPSRPRDLAPGDRVDVEFREHGRDAPQITAIRRIAPAAKSGSKS
jgi:Cu(I)/Ag(I) efflux system membrane fusion protein